MNLDLEAIKARADAAKAGPWVWKSVTIGDDPPVDGNRYLTSHATRYGVIGPSQSTMFCDDEDAEFIAHARTDVPALVAEVEELRSIVRMLAACEWECESDCFFCGGSAVGGPSHEADCPHVLAVAYVAANPA